MRPGVSEISLPTIPAAEHVWVLHGQQALYSLLDAFAKAILTCVPEPPPDARPQAIAIAKVRYERLVKAAGQAMSGDLTRAAMQDLVDHGTN